MKFVHIADVAYPHIGGVEYVVYRYSKMHAGDGHRAYVISSKMKDVANRENIDGVNYIRISKYALATKLPKYINNIKPDLVHTHSYIGALSLSLLWKINKNIPILRHIHDVYIGKLKEYSGWDISKIYERLERILITLPYTGFIVPSAYTGNMLVKLGVPQSMINVVNPGVDVDKFGKSDGTYARKKYNIPSDKKIVGFVGRISTGKGPQFLIEVAKSLDAYFVMVGPNPNPKTSGIVGIRKELERKAKEYGIEERVIFTGKVEEWELPLYYDSFDIFCLPSLSEGFGMSIIEAMAAGKPVVSFDTTAIPEIVKHGYNGLLAKLKDVEDLREKLVALLSNTTLYEKLAANAKEFSHRYTWEASYSRLMEVYNNYL